jgi:hypothetical protein
LRCWIDFARPPCSPHTASLNVPLLYLFEFCVYETLRLFCSPCGSVL